MADKPKKARVKKRHHVLKADADIQARLGAIVRACRHKLGITQEELAWRANLHRTYIADIERGARNVTLRSVATVAKALEITIGHLFAHVTAPSGTAPRAGAETGPDEVRDILLVEHNAAAAAMTARAFGGRGWRIHSESSATERPRWTTCSAPAGMPTRSRSGRS